MTKKYLVVVKKSIKYFFFLLDSIQSSVVTNASTISGSKHERDSSMTRPPTLKVISDAMVVADTARMSRAILDNMESFALLIFHQFKILKLYVLGNTASSKYCSTSDFW